MKNRSTVSAFLALAFLLLFAPRALYGEEPNDGAASAACDVFVEVGANVAVMAMAASLDLGSIQTGVFSGTIPFRVDANTERLKIWAATTRLFKGDDPDTVHVAPIKLAYQSTVDIYPHNANPVGGEDNHARYRGLYQIDDFPGYYTESIVFESAQNGHFSQQVDMVVWWDQDDPERPMGEYSGKVRLLAEVVLPGD